MSITGAPPSIPGARAVFGHLFTFRKDPIGFLSSAQKTYGDFVHMKLAGRDVYLVSSPELISEILVTRAKEFKKSRALQLAKDLLGEGLLTSEGEHHLKQRRMIAPAFHRKKIMEYGRVMTEEAMKFRLGPHPGTMDLHEEMMRLTLRIVGRTLFDADVEGDAKEVGEAMHSALSMFERVTNPFAAVLRYVPTPTTLRFRAARRKLFGIIDRIILEHQREHHEDLVSMLLAAVDEDDSSRMSLKQVRYEALTLFLAGHETTANALTWAFYLLSRNPAARTRMLAEVDSAAAGLTDDQPLHPEDAARLPYTRNVFAESLRLYPPAWVVGRSPLHRVEIGGHGLEKNSIVLMSQIVVQRDARWFQSPLEFKPERWETEDPSRPKFAYFPFGGGPRTCIGDQFAWMEGTLLLAEISRGFTFDPVLDRAEAQPLITLRPRSGMPVRIHRRTQGS
jgi:cytochrome P450